MTQAEFTSTDEVYRIFTSGWYLYLSSLCQHVETGTGHAHPYLDFAQPNLWFGRKADYSAKPAIAYGAGA